MHNTDNAKASHYKLSVQRIPLTRGRFKNAYLLLNLRALKMSMLCKNHIFQCMVRYFVWNFKGYLWNSTRNVLPIHWKMQILSTGENLRALRFKNSKVFLKRSQYFLCPGDQGVFPKRWRTKNSRALKILTLYNLLSSSRWLRYFCAKSNFKNALWTPLKISCP